MDLVIRSLTAADIEFALTQTTREGWDTTAELFQVCLAHDPTGCFVAELDRTPVGMITTTRYRHTAWVGNLIVLPDCRSRGVGRRLMSHALDYLERTGVRTVRLEADPPGVPLYRSLGFEDEFESIRFKGEPVASSVSDAVEQLSPSDLPLIAAFDGAHFGDDRSRLLRLLPSHGGMGCVLRKRGSVEGYGMLVPSTVGIRLGPCVASDRPTAHLLLQSLWAAAGERTMILGVPCLNVEALELLESAGFIRCGSCRRMIRGLRNATGIPAHIYAIANGAMG